MILASITPTERDVLNIVGASYDRRMGGEPERFNPHRLLTLTAIPGAYEYASHVVFAIRGTPTRGLVVLPVDYLNAAVDYYGCRDLGMRQTDVLRKFLRSVCPTKRVPLGWRWVSAAPATTSPVA